MTAKTSSDSTLGVSRILFCGIQDSFTTQFLNSGLEPPTLNLTNARAACRPTEIRFDRGGCLEARPKKRTRPVLDNDYEIKPRHPDPQEDAAQNQADAERPAEREFQFSS